MLSFAESIKKVAEAANPAAAYSGLLVSLQLARFIPSDEELTTLHTAARTYDMADELLQIQWADTQGESCRLC